MSEATKPSPKGSDWTRLLTDPDLVSHLGTLLQTYREVSPEQREAALLQVMRKIKEQADSSRKPKTEVTVPATSTSATATATAVSRSEPVVFPAPEPVTVTPPFEPDLYTTAVPGSDRRTHHRIKCYVAVEIHVEDVKEPIWGNLSNVSRGGCMVETASPVPTGKALEIGLWVSSGKLWVKGIIISGIATAQRAVLRRAGKNLRGRALRERAFARIPEVRGKHYAQGAQRHAYVTQLKA